MPVNETEVLIVGAGISGLSAARILQQSGIPYIILEARDRCGGRLFTEKYENDIYLDLGGQWLGPGQNNSYDLCREHSIQTFKTYNTGHNITALNGSLKKYVGLIPKLSPLALVNIDFILKRLDGLAQQLDVYKPWQHKQSSKWDSITLASYLDKFVWLDESRKVIDAGLNTLFGLENNEISLLQALFYIKSGTNLNGLLSIDQGAQQDKLVGGAQQLCTQLANKMPETIFYNEEVIQLEREKNKTTVHTRNQSFVCQKVIFAIPPVLLAKIQFIPGLNVARMQLLQRMPMGNLYKCHMVFRRPFWREEGLSGQSVCDEEYPMQTTFDNSPVDGAYGVITSFCMGKRADKLLNLYYGQRQELIADHLIKLFGNGARDYIFYDDKCWGEDIHSGGCYVGMRTPGTWTRYKNLLAEPENNLYFAGTETASIWNGYIEGGINAGRRAANEVLNSLSPKAK